jgi:hypothetical protein
MKPQSLVLVCLFGCLAGLSSLAQAAANPYLAPIAGRNVFGLVKVLETRPGGQAPMAVTLRGIARLPAGTHALLHLPRTANSTGERSLWLRAGVPAREQVQVLQINVSAATVEVDHHGQIQTLKLEGN